MTKLLPDWHGIGLDDRAICIMADSTGNLDVGDTNENTYPMLIRERMRASWGIDGTGFLGTWRSEWTFAGSWTQSIASDLWGQGPYINDAILTPYRGTQKATTSAATATFTIPSWLRETATSVVLYMVDGVSSANFSYSVDGGAWTDTAATWTQNSKMKRVTLSVTPTTSIAIRGATAAGVARTIYLSAVEIKTSTSGATLHDLSASSTMLYDTAENNTSPGNSDAMGFLDLLQPQALVVSYTNDDNGAPYYNLTRIASDLAYITTRQTYGTMLPMPFWGQSRDASTDASHQTGISNTYQAAATSNAYINLYARYGTYATVNGLGYMADTLHPDDDGCREIAQVLWRMLSRGDDCYRCRA